MVTFPANIADVIFVFQIIVPIKLFFSSFQYIFVKTLFFKIFCFRSRGIKNKHLKAGVEKNENIYSWCLKTYNKYYLVVQPAFSFSAAFWYTFKQQPKVYYSQ